MLLHRHTLRMVRTALVLASCAAFSEACAGSMRAGGHGSERLAPGEPCDPRGPQLLDGDLKPVDLEDPASVELAAGHPVLACIRLTQEFSGRVLDEATRAPIAGAQISVKAWQSPTPALGQHVPRDLVYAQETITDAQGRWKLPSVSQWMAGLLAADGLPFVGSTQCVRAEGYQVQIFDPWRRTADVTPDLSEVALKRGHTLGCP